MALEQSGWTVFLAARDLPEQIEAAEWSQRIDEALDGAGTLVLLASPEALTKKWVTYEWRSFHNDILADRGGWIVPCCVRGLAPDELRGDPPGASLPTVVAIPARASDSGARAPVHHSR